MNPLKSKNWVDTHFHVFNAGVAIEGARYVPQYSAVLSDWMRQAKNVGVTRGVWVQPSFLGNDNSLMLDALKAHPDMLRGIAVVRPDVSLQEFNTLHEIGVRGIRLNLAGVSHDIPAWAQAHLLWETMQSRGWHLEVHTDQGKLPHVLSQLPSDLPLVVDHMAKPFHANANDPTLLALKMRATVSPVYVKLSSAYRLGKVDPGRLAALLLNELGSSALLWGSDWPCTNHEQFADFEKLISQAHEWIASEHVEQIMASNPLRLYWDDFSSRGEISRC